MKYIYHGPLSSVTLRDTDTSKQEIDVMLRPGQQVELPEEHEYVQTLLAQAYLTPVTDEQPTAKTSKITKVKEQDNGS